MLFPFGWQREAIHACMLVVLIADIKQPSPMYFRSIDVCQYYAKRIPRQMWPAGWVWQEAWKDTSNQKHEAQRLGKTPANEKSYARMKSRKNVKAWESTSQTNEKQKQQKSGPQSIVALCLLRYQDIVKVSRKY